MKQGSFLFVDVIRQRLAMVTAVTGLALATLGTERVAAQTDITWDTNPGTVGAGDSAITGGIGTWDLTNGNWTIDGGINNQAWINGNNAIFGGTGGVVTLGSAITADDITFATGGYNITAGTLTLSGTPTITAGSGVFGTISSSIAGSNGLTFQGSGSAGTYLDGNNNYTGVTNVNSAFLIARHANSLGSSADGTIVTSGATLQLENGGGGDVNIASEAVTISGTGVGGTRGALASWAGNNTWGGNVTMAANSSVLVNSGNLSINGVISGTGMELTKVGGAQLTLGGASSNTYTGKTIVDNGTLLLSKTGGAYAIIGDVQMGNGATNQPNLRATADNQFGPGVVMTFVNPFGAFPRFDLQGTVQTLAGVQGSTGAGVIQNERLGGGGTAGPATLILDGSGDYSFTGYVRDRDGGAGTWLLNIAKNGTGTQTLAGGNVTYTGTTTVNSGKLRLTDVPSFASDVTVNGTGTLEVNAVGNFSFNRTISGAGNFLKAGAATLTITGTTTNSLSGTAVIENGTTNLNKTGGAFAFTGPVQMGNGTAGLQPNLRMGANNQFGPDVVMSFANPSGSWTRFDLLGTSQTLAGIQNTLGSGVIQNGGIGVGSTTNATLTINNTADFSYNGYIRNFDNVNNGGVLNLIKTGSGTQTLVGGNISYTGTTTVNGGTLKLQDTVISTAITVNTGGTLSSARTALGGANRFAINGNAVVLAGGTLSIDGAGVGLAGGWTTFNATNGLTGSGTININSGVFSRDNTVANAINTSATVNVAGGAFFGAGRGGNSTIGALNGSGVVSTLWSGASAGSITIGNGDGSGSFAGTLDGNGSNAADLTQQGGVLSVIKVGSGTQTLTGANTYSGATTVNGGFLVIQNLASGSNNANLSGGKVFTTSSLNVASGATVVVDLGATSLASTNSGLTITGAGTIQKNGAGTWWLGNGAGGTAISMAAGGLIDLQAGVLKNDYANANWSGNNGNLNIATGASVDMRNNSVRVGALTGGGLLDNAYTSAQTLTVGAGDASGVFTGNVRQTGGGPLSVTKIGTGTQTLGGSLTAFSGTTTVSQGSLILDGTNLVNASPWSIAAGANLTINYANTAVDTWVSGGAITGTGTLTKTGPGWFLFKDSAPANFQGAIVINGGRLGNGFNTTVWTNSKADVFVGAGAELDMRVDDMIIDELTGTGTVVNTFTVGGSDTLSVGSNNGSSQFDGVIRGIGGVGANNTSIDIGRTNLAKIGTGTFTLTGANVYGGTTTVNDGILRISGGNDRLPVTTQLIVNGGATVGGTFDLNGLNQTVAGMSGAAGAVTGSITSTTGPSVLTANVLGTNVFTTAANLSDTGIHALSLTKSGTGTQGLSGANTHSGKTLVTGGALRQSSATALSPNSNIELNGGILELGATNFVDSLGTTGGKVQFTGSGGFGAFGAPRDVNIGGAAATLTWGTGNFVPTGSSLILSGPNSDNTTRFLNGINLAGGPGRITSLGGTATVDAQLVGNISNGSLTLAPANSTFEITGQITANTIVESGLTGSTSFPQLLLNRAGGNAIAGGFQIGTADILDPGTFSTVRAMADNQIADTTVVTFGGAQGRWSYYNLNGFNETIGGLSNLAGRDGGVVQLVEGDPSPVTNSTLTLNVASGTQSYFGHIRDRSSGVTNDPGGNGRLNFVKDGSGTQELTTWNTQVWSGTTTVNAGTLRIALAGSTGGGGALSSPTTVASGATLDFSNAANNNSWTFNGTLTGAGTISKSGNGMVNFTGAGINPTGPTLVNQGILRLTDQNYASPVTIAAGATLEENRTVGSGTMNMTISGPGTFSKIGAGETIVASPLTHTGTTHVRGGTLAAGAANVLSGGSDLTVGGSGAATVKLNGFNQTVGGLSGSLDATARVVNGSATQATLTVNQTSGQSVFGGRLGGDGADDNNFGLLKQGAGTLVLTGQNTHTGGVTISGGTVQLGATTTIPTIAGLSIWLDGADPNATGIAPSDGSSISVWKNKGTLGATGDFAAVTGQEPTYASAAGVMNGNSVVHFDATPGDINTNQTSFDRLTNPINLSSGPSTVLVAGRYTGSAVNNHRLVAGIVNNWLLGWWNGGVNGAYTGSNFTPAMTAGDTLAHTYSVTMRADGTVDTFGELGRLGGGVGVGPNGLALGAGYQNQTREYSTGDIGELIVIQGTLSDADRAALEAYLARKWTGSVPTNILPTTTAVSLTASGAKLDVNGATQSIGSLSGVTGSIVDLNSGSLTVGDSTNTVFGGSITGSGSFTKVGSGTLELSGNNTPTGNQVLVQGGTLLVTGDLTGSVLEVQSGGTLGGNGTIGSDGYILTGGKLSPGTSPGTLTFTGSTFDFSDAVLNTNSQSLLFELGSSSDLVSLTTGLFGIGIGVLEFDDFVFTPVSGFAPGTYTLFDSTQDVFGNLGTNLNGTVGGLPATLSLGDSDNDIILTVVPEPSTALLAGGLGLLFFRRRRA